MGHVLKKVAAWLCTVGVACGLGWAALTAGTGPVTAPAVAEARPATVVEAQYPGLKDNFYEAVNRDWFDRWDVPPTDAYVDNFYLLRDENRTRLRAIMEEANANTSAEEGSDERNVGALWATGLDREARNAGGWGDAEEFLAAIDDASSVTELLEASTTFDRAYGCSSFFGLNVGADSEDSARKVYYLTPSDTGLSQELWFSDAAESQEQARLYQELLAELWTLNGAAPEEAAATAEGVAGAMKELAASSLTTAERYDPTLTYNVYRLSDLEELYGGLLPLDLIYELYGGQPDDVLIVQDEGLLQATAALLAEADLDLLKSYAKSCLFVDLAEYGTVDAFEAKERYETEYMGLEESLSLESDLVNQLQKQAPFECGRLYADRYFSKESQAEIQAMVDDIVAVYERRIRALDWMGDETKEEALDKLQAIASFIGVPDEWPQDAYELALKRPEEGGLFVNNVLEAHRAVRDAEFAAKNEPVDKTRWFDAPQTVNAYYYPLTNSITLMAGILQPPFYDPNAAPEQNLGRIGMIIAHEITHAFDSMGSLYDAEGNLRDWWTAEDAQRFEELAQRVVDCYDGREVNGFLVDGELTLGENIADLGAVACITEVAKERGYDLQQVYVAFGQTWPSKIRSEYMAEIIATDTHAPEELRVNVVLSATDGFYEAFGIEEGDGMYVAPEDRPQVW